MEEVFFPELSDMLEKIWTTRVWRATRQRGSGLLGYRAGIGWIFCTNSKNNREIYTGENRCNFTSNMMNIREAIENM